ncbi:MAG: pyruvate dehydrogenase (acetyl-transferring), homodimeric type [Bacteroidia bacterium]|nr:MAG: pyruvate dehydrogenase (acetyl-transferring), homodimeric type [Bacteroidia bacterium]
MNNDSNNNIDAVQLKEWLDSIDNVIDYDSNDTAVFLLKQIAARLKQKTGIVPFTSISTDYVNTISVDNQLPYPGNKEIEQRLDSYMRWNAIAMVCKANKISSELGGHMSSYLSIATLYEVGFNHFWRAPTNEHHGDLVFFQGHSAPGVYSRSYVEGRFNDDLLKHYRQEALQVGLSSYPHPWLMPDYWQFPTVSMGLGPLLAIYNALLMRYLGDRGLLKVTDQKVWCFIGDGETSEPETLGNINIAGREHLANLIFVINCNLQRLDGLVSGNSKIIQEMESLFLGANWKVIKVVWGSGWDELLARDKSGKLKQIMMDTIDGEYQNYRAKDGNFIRTNFFGKSPETLELVKDLSDDDIWNLTRGGHDIDKVYNAYREAVYNSENKPVVILAKTIKGYGLKGEGESQNVAHNTKKLPTDALKIVRDHLDIPITDEELADITFYRPKEDSPEAKYLHEQRAKLGGSFPIRKPVNEQLAIPSIDAFGVLLKDTGEREMSTTMAFVRILNILTKDKNIAKNVVPIVPDESRTFGMEGMFRQVGIWAHEGQKYTPEDASQLMYYKEDTKGQIFQEGINEPGAMAQWIAAATSYANFGVSTIPFYVYYSMFGFQRVGDLAWLAGDIRARGFLIGGVAGRTTLNGEGLQHEDGHSHIQAGLIPSCESYDPTFACELAVIIQHGLQEMFVENKDKFYYITVMNESYTHPELVAGSTDGIIKGCYLFKKIGDGKISVNLMGSGTIFREVIQAAEILASEYNLTVNIFSATSYNKLRRDGLNVTRSNKFHPLQQPEKPYITKLLEATQASLTVSATDYIRSYSDQIREYVPSEFVTLGTDGYGRSDWRTALREFFEVDCKHVVVATLSGLADAGLIDKKIVADAINKYNIDANKANPWEL